MSNDLPHPKHFHIGQRVRFWVSENKRMSGMIYDALQAHINPMGISVPQKLCVTLRYGRNHQNVSIDATYCELIP